MFELWLVFLEPPDYLPTKTTRQIVFDPSSLTSSEPSCATSTPTGRPHTSPAGVTNPVMKSSNSPLGTPFFCGTRMTLYPVRFARFHDPCSAANASLRYSLGNIFPV